MIRKRRSGSPTHHRDEPRRRRPGGPSARLRRVAGRRLRGRLWRGQPRQVLRASTSGTGRVTIGGLTRSCPTSGPGDGTVDRRHPAGGILIVGGPPADGAARHGEPGGVPGAWMEYSTRRRSASSSRARRRRRSRPARFVALILAGHGSP
jgi:hypothetical protein